MMRKLCRTFMQRKSLRTFYSFGKEGTGLIVPPFIDFENRLENIGELKKSIELRGLKIDIDSLIGLWNEYQILQGKRKSLLESKQLISKKYRALNDISNNKTHEVEHLKALGKMTKDDLRVINLTLKALEDRVIETVMALPNDLDSRTTSKEIIVKSFNCQTSGTNTIKDKKVSHVEFDSPTCYYLLKRSAELELEVTRFFWRVLAQEGFIPFSNPDTVRNVIVEGCNIDYPDVIPISEKSSTNQEKLFLTGGSSRFTFLAYHTRQIVDVKYLPLKYVCKGRMYCPKLNETSDLNDAWQSSAVQIFIAASCSNSINCELENVTQVLFSLYKKLGLNVRLSYASASNLKSYEKLRILIEIYSPYHGKFIESGNVSLYGDFISKRLRMYFKNGQHNDFLYVLEGTALNFTSLLTCLSHFSEQELMSFMKKIHRDSSH